MWFVTGAACLVLLAVLLASIVLALVVLVRRRNGRILAIISLVLAALPLLLIVASAVRATFKPSYNAQSTNAWELAVIKGMAAMNKGDGKSFTENAHTDFKNEMRNLMLNRLREHPTTAETLKCIKDYGVSTLDELEKIPVDRFIEMTIYWMHVTQPPAMRTASEEAQFKPLGSKLQGDTYRVTVEMSLNLNGKLGVRNAILLAKKEGGVWKYNGQAW